MNQIRLGWEPKNKTPLKKIEEIVRKNLKKGKNYGATIMENGTLLFTLITKDSESDAKKAMSEAKYLIDFQVMGMRDGGYLVKFHNAVSVYVSEEEFNLMRAEIKRRISELQFPGECLFGDGSNEKSLFIGLYARGKLQYDAYHFSFYRRIE